MNHSISLSKDNANERNESSLSNCRVQLFFCKDTPFLRDSVQNPCFLLLPSEIEPF